MKRTASPTVASRVATRLGIAMANRSSHDMTISTTSRLSAPRSSVEARIVGEAPLVSSKMEDEDIPDFSGYIVHRTLPSTQG